MVESPTILVIEDYSDTRLLLSSFLRAHGFKVIEARDGKEGFIQANRVIPDLILMDLALPEMDGVPARVRISYDERKSRERRKKVQEPGFWRLQFRVSSFEFRLLEFGIWNLLVLSPPWQPRDARPGAPEWG